MGTKQTLPEEDKESCQARSYADANEDNASTSEESNLYLQQDDRHAIAAGVGERNDVESRASSTGTPDNGEESVFFHVLLRATVEGVAKKGTVVFSRYPKTGEEFKEEVERQYNVPVCVQTLSFHTSTIRDDTRLKSLKVQEGDTLEVSYPAPAEIEYFTSLLNTLTRIISLLKHTLPQLMDGAEITDEMHGHLLPDCDGFSQDSSHIEYFSVFPTGTPNANQLYFIHHNGLRLLIEMYELLHLLPWHQLPLEVQELEYACLKIMWNFSATLGIRRLLMEHGVLECTFHSLLRAKVEPNKHIAIGQPLADRFGSERYSTYVLAETIYAAIVAIGNFAEIPECRLTIASAPDVTGNMIAAMLCPTYTYACCRSGMCALLCLSFSPETHQFLIDDSTLDSTLKISSKGESIVDNITGIIDNDKLANQTLVRFFTAMFFAKLIHNWSVDTRLPKNISSIATFMEEYMADTPHSLIHKCFHDKRYYWSTFTPFLSLCYTHRCHDDSILGENKDMLHQLSLLCVRAGLLSMKCLCLADNVVDIIEYEGLADYITCLPWNMPDSLTTASATEVVLIARQSLTLQPPSLTNIVKAHLASYHCGLEKVLQCDAYTLVVDVIENLSHSGMV